MGPIHPACDAVGIQKYRGPNEDHREMCNRVAGFLQDGHDHYMAFRQTITSLRFSPPGRVLAGAGALKNVTLYNCFVMPTIHDSFTHGPSDEERAATPVGEFPSESIMDVAKLAAHTMRQGGGVGYDISTLRPSGAEIRGVGGTTDGPVGFANIYDMVGRSTSSAGNRRGAQMLVMRSDHPDIETFIRAKQVADQSIPWDMRPLRGFNMSVGVTDDLIEAIDRGSSYKLQFGGKVYSEVDAQALWDMIMRGTYDFAEPGVLFIDQINRMNNLYYCETIAATNPCGEQPLPPYGACLLGSFNLTKYLVPNTSLTAKRRWEFDWELLRKDIPIVVRAMDNVIDRSRYPLPQQKQEATRKRRMGLGITGLANALEALGYPYGSPEFLEFQGKVQEFITNLCYQSSALLAKEKGSFPLYDENKYLSGKFITTLWSETQKMIKRNGIRNSHLTSIAPTGTISFYADNVSSGIEPVIAYEQDRTVIMKEGPTVFRDIPDYGVAHLGVKGRTVFGNDITADEHLAVLAMAQMNVDSAVSKTVNVPSDFSYESFKNLYLNAAKLGCKGITTYRPAGNYDEPIKASKKSQSKQPIGGVCELDEFGRKSGACAD